MAKPRVYELAKVLNVDSKTVLEKLKDMGEFVKSASSTIEPPVARRLKAEFAKDNAKGDSKPVQQRRPAAPSAPASTSSSAPTPAAPARQASPASAHQQAPTPGAPTPRPQGGARPGMPTPGRHGQNDNRENGRDNREGRENGRQSRPNDRRNNDRRNNQGRPNNSQPVQHQNNRGNASAPRPHAQGGAGANGGNAASNAIPRPHAQGPRPGNNPFSRKQGMHTPTPGDIPRPHPMARPTADNGRGGRPGRPGQGQGQGRGFRGGRPGQGGQGGPRPGQWGHNRPGQGGGSQGAGQGGARGGFRGGQGGGNNFQGGGAPSNGPARGGGRGGRGGAAGAFGRQGGKSSKARKNRLAKRHEYEELKAPTIGGVRIPNGNGQTIRLRQGASLADLAEKINVNQAALVTVLFHLGQMATATQSLDEETFQILGEEIGWNIQLVSAEEEDKELLQQFDINLDEEELQDDEDLKPRPPVVTVMGHVDHGKTRLLDTIRKTNVIAREAGGITQRIGAYQVTVNLEGEPRKITFLDTPGHEAFTAMRARGAKVTDLCIIIVAADDDVMPQTVEAINHASAAGVPIVFAINKIDKPAANPDKIKEELAGMNYLVEEWGGKYQSQDISAKKGLGVEELLEKVLLEAEMLDLKANPDRNATGSIIESSLDKGRGYVATVLVQNGTLRVGDIILAGTHFGKVKAMFNERNQRIKEAGPAEPALILGLNGAPTAGDTFTVLDSEQEAREIATKRQQLQRELSTRTSKRLTLDEVARRQALGSFQELNVIVKGDVDGSIEALSDSLIKLSTPEIQVNVIHKAVGEISESDVSLAAASEAIIIGFQVRPSQAARREAEREGVEIRLYSVIYQAIEEVKDAMAGMLAPELKEEITGTAEVLETYKISKVGTIAGAIVREGKIKRTNKVRVIRDGIVRYTGALGSLKRFKDDAKEVVAGLECGLSIQGYNDVQAGDIIEGFEEIEVARAL